VRLYLEFVKNAILANSTYRVNLFIRLLNRIIELFIFASIWKALYSGAAETTSNMGVISLNDMIMYSIISSGISVFISNNLISDISDKIRTGQIALDMIKPINFKAWQLCNVIGTNISGILLELVPVLVIGGLAFGFRVPEWKYLILFFISLAGGIAINFLITYILGILGFWFLEVSHFERLLQDLVKVFSGAWFPIWFFPKVLIGVSGYLPFKYIYFAPVSIYLSKVSIPGALSILVQQLIWIAVLFLIGEVLWRKGTAKLVIQGG